MSKGRLFYGIHRGEYAAAALGDHIPLGQAVAPIEAYKKCGLGNGESASNTMQVVGAIHSDSIGANPDAALLSIFAIWR